MIIPCLNVVNKQKDPNGIPLYYPGHIEKTYCYKYSDVGYLQEFLSLHPHLHLVEFELAGVKTNKSQNAKNSNELMAKLIKIMG